MPRMPVTVLLFVTLALSLPGQAVAGPPERPPAKMVLDEVADGLRHYRKETDPEKRLHWLTKLAPTRDPRVAVALGEAIEMPMKVLPDGTLEISRERIEVYRLLAQYYVTPPDERRTDKAIGPYGVLLIRIGASPVKAWWEQNEPELRHCAARLPK